MSRSRDLANLAGDATGLETLTVSDITDLTASATELNYVDGVGSAIQAQINTKIGGSNPTLTLGSNTTFPPGSVINLETALIASSGGHTLNTTDSYLTGHEFTYDVKEETSKLYVAYYPLLQTEHDGANYTHKFSLRSSVDSYASTIGGGNVPNFVHYGQTSQTQWLQFPIIVSCFHDHNQTSGTTITYRMYGKTKVNTAGIYTWDTWAHSGTPNTTQHAVIFEVAQ